MTQGTFGLWLSYRIETPEQYAQHCGISRSHNLHNIGKKWHTQCSSKTQFQYCVT